MNEDPVVLEVLYAHPQPDGLLIDRFVMTGTALEEFLLQEGSEKGFYRIEHLVIGVNGPEGETNAFVNLNHVTKLTPRAAHPGELVAPEPF